MIQQYSFADMLKPQITNIHIILVDTIPTML